MRYWQQHCDDLAQIPLATMIQPLPTIEQSGRLWITDTQLVVERCWGVHWLGAPQEIDGDITVLDRITGQACFTRKNPQQLVHTILGHWPRALPTADPLMVSDNHWLLPHSLLPDRLPNVDIASVPEPRVKYRMRRCWPLASSCGRHAHNHCRWIGNIVMALCGYRRCIWVSGWRCLP
ncbi:MAG: hypothetical protein HC805_05910 [Alkalinema sp. RL_2_19]|nr:hypothetical protein [Alkalinema sp. RL_2_19]